MVCIGRAGYVPEKPAHKVGTLLLTWQDAKRDREVPVEIYYPLDAKGPCPLIIFSHGLGGSRFGYGYLGEHWAGCGYICVHVQHHGSDDAVWRDAGFGAYAALTKAVADTRNAVNRAEDVKFAINQMFQLNDMKALGGYDPFLGRIDEKEVGMAGHSFGAWTTLAVVGEKNPAGVSFIDPRIKAAIAMSPPVPGGAPKAVGQFTAIAVPVFHMTGTKDDSPIGETQAADRRIPFDQATTPGTCLLTLNGADHMTFSGHLFRGYNAEDAHFQKYILAGSTAFWDATLRGNAAAREWLYHGGFAAMLGKEGTFETK